MVKELCTLTFLGVNAWTDIRKKEVSLISVLAAGVSGIVWSWQSGRGLLQVIISAGIGLAFLALSFITREALGMGDAWMLLAFGMMVETEEFVTDICMGMLLAGAWSMILLVVLKKNRNTEIPFVPFLLAGYVGGLVIW